MGGKRINPHYYWLGMLEYRLQRKAVRKWGEDLPPFKIPCFDPAKEGQYPTFGDGKVGFTFPLKCVRK